MYQFELKAHKDKLEDLIKYLSYLYNILDTHPNRNKMIQTEIINTNNKIEIIIQHIKLCEL
jgi:hypothetical protein